MAGGVLLLTVCQYEPGAIEEHRLGGGGADVQGENGYRPGRRRRALATDGRGSARTIPFPGQLWG